MTIVQKDHLRIRRNICLGDARNQRTNTSFLKMNLKKIPIGLKKKWSHYHRNWGWGQVRSINGDGISMKGHKRNRCCPILLMRKYFKSLKFKK
jgi:hypothetical protein